MSGIRVYNFREGDRSEYLANYLLSGLGLVTAVPRQEDIGFDFYCQLADQETGHLTFGFPFVMQIKSEGVKSITYGEQSSKNWKAEDVKWLFRLDIPLFIGIVCKKKMQLDIYNTSTLNFVFFENPNASILELKPRLNNSLEEILPPTKELITEWERGKGDGYKHKVDLGNPIITITNEDIYEKENLKNKKSMLRNIVFLEQENYLFRKLKVPYFRWTRIIKTTGDVTPGWFHLIPKQFQFGDFYGSAFAHSLVSIAINLEAKGRHEEALELRPVLRKIRGVDPSIKKTFPHLFD